MQSGGAGPALPSPAAKALTEIDLRHAALFFDVDGTLLELAPTPDAVRVELEVVNLLRTVSILSEGAVALVSGRPISTLDNLFWPLAMPCADLHGFERRDARGTYQRHPLPPGNVLCLARSLMVEFVARHPGLLLEDKWYALAMHYRQMPRLQSEVEHAMAEIARSVAPALRIQHGRMVVEVRPAGADKGSAVAQFLQESPFSGRCPLYFGDDLTDEDAFAKVNECGGISIAVNVASHTAASWRFESCSHVHLWLREQIKRSH